MLVPDACTMPRHFSKSVFGKPENCSSFIEKRAEPRGKTAPHRPCCKARCPPTAARLSPLPRHSETPRPDRPDGSVPRPWHRQSCHPVSYTHLTLPTNREV